MIATLIFSMWVLNNCLSSIFPIYIQHVIDLACTTEIVEKYVIDTWAFLE
jgi:hypothetical protein